MLTCRYCEQTTVVVTDDFDQFLAAAKQFLGQHEACQPAPTSGRYSVSVINSTR